MSVFMEYFQDAITALAALPWNSKQKTKNYP
jgi:hypothetical protein